MKRPLEGISLVARNIKDEISISGNTKDENGKPAEKITLSIIKPKVPAPTFDPHEDGAEVIKHKHVNGDPTEVEKNVTESKDDYNAVHATKKGISVINRTIPKDVIKKIHRTFLISVTHHYPNLSNVKSKDTERKPPVVILEHAVIKVIFVAAIFTP